MSKREKVQMLSVRQVNEDQYLLAKAKSDPCLLNDLRGASGISPEICFIRWRYQQLLPHGQKSLSYPGVLLNIREAWLSFLETKFHKRAARYYS